MESHIINFTGRICTVDTNVILRWLLGDNPEQFKVVHAVLSSPQLKKCYVPDIVLAECVWVLQSMYTFDRDLVAEILTVLVDTPVFVFNRQVFVDTLALYQTKKSLSFVDCLLLMQTRQNNTQPLLTFDAKLQRVADSLG